MRGHVLGEPAQSRALAGGVVGLAGDQRAGQGLVAALRGATDAHEPGAVVNRLDGHPLLGCRVDEIARRDLVLLRREAQRVDE